MILDEVTTISEASKMWLVPSDTLKKACSGQKGYPPRFTQEECRKAGNNWIITRAGMIRLYGEPKSNKNI